MIRRFQAFTGMDFSDYVQHRRIELACRLLLETDQKPRALVIGTPPISARCFAS